MAYGLYTTGDENNNSGEEESIIENTVIDESTFSSSDSDDNSVPVVPHPETKSRYDKTIGTWRSCQYYGD